VLVLDESLTVLLILVDIIEIALCVIVLSEINDNDDDYTAKACAYSCQHCLRHAGVGE